MLLRSEEEGGGRANGNGGGGLDGATTTETDTKADKYKSNDNNDELNFIFDKIGQCFDRSYIAINLLIGDLETQFFGTIGRSSTVYSNLALYNQIPIEEANSKANVG